MDSIARSLACLSTTTTRVTQYYRCSETAFWPAPRSRVWRLAALSIIHPLAHPLARHQDACRCRPTCSRGTASSACSPALLLLLLLLSTEEASRSKVLSALVDREEATLYNNNNNTWAAEDHLAVAPPATASPTLSGHDVHCNIAIS